MNVKTSVVLPIDDVTSRSGRNERSAIIEDRRMSKTVEWCIPDKKCVLKTDRKPWSDYQTVMLFPV